MEKNDLVSLFSLKHIVKLRITDKQNRKYDFLAAVIEKYELKNQPDLLNGIEGYRGY